MITYHMTFDVDVLEAVDPATITSQVVAAATDAVRAIPGVSSVSVTGMAPEPEEPPTEVEGSPGGDS